MNKTLLISRQSYFLGSSLAVMLVVMTAPAFGQTHIFNGDGTTSSPNLLGFEAQPGGPGTSLFVDGTGAATSRPGSSLDGAATDQVLIQKQAGGNNETVRINNVDVGMIDTLTIGGLGANGTGGDDARVQVRGDNGDIQINTLTLGVGGGDSNPGQFLVSNAGSSATIGTVLSGSTDTVSRLQVGANAAGGLTLTGDIDSSGTREIDFFIQANDDVTTSRVDLQNGNQLLSVDIFRIGSSFNANNFDASFTLDDNNTVEANVVQVSEAGGNNTNTSNGSGTLTITNSTLNAIGTNGRNGNIQIARSQTSNATAVNETEGTLNVGANGNVIVSNLIQLGSVNVTTANPNQLSTGTLELNDATAVVTVGRIDTDNTVAGGINAGQTRDTTGIINLIDGTLNSFDRVLLAGDGTNGNDQNSVGELNIDGGTLNIGADPNFTANGGTAGLNGEVISSTGAARDQTVGIQTSNLEVGRSGEGTITQTGGEINIFRGNLVLGQTATGTAAGASVSRGTVDISGGGITVGVVQGADPNNMTEFQSDINFNQGGGDIDQSGNSFINVERNFNFGANDPGQAINTFTISDTASLSLGANLNGEFGVVTVNGDTTDIDVGSTLNFNADSILEFDFAGTSDYDFDFDVANVVNYNDARLNLNSITSGLDLTSFDGDILLLDIGNSANGTFINAAQGDLFGAYQLVYDYDPTGFVAGSSDAVNAGGGNSLALVRAVAVPEPGSLALLGLSVLGMVARRRRS